MPKRKGIEQERTVSTKMRQQSLKAIALALIALLVSFPFASLPVFADGNIEQVRVTSTSREGNVFKPTDALTISTKATVEGVSPLNESYLSLYIPSTWFSYGAQACTALTDGYYMCDYDTAAPDNGWPAGKNTGKVNLYSSMERIAANLLATEDYAFYVDDKPPKITAFTASQTGSTLTINYNAQDETSGTDGRCAGMKSNQFVITEVTSDPSPKTTTIVQNFGEANTACGFVPAANNTRNLKESDMPTAFTDFDGMVNTCMSAKDKLDLESAQRCANNARLDWKAPEKASNPENGDFEVSIVDDETNIPIWPADSIKSGQKIKITANFTDSSPVTTAVLNASFFNAENDAQKLPGTIRNVDSKLSVTWKFTATRVSPIIQSVKAKITDMYGNELFLDDRNPLLARDKLPMPLLDNTAPKLVSVKSQTGFLKANRNTIRALLDDTPADNAQGSSGFENDNIDLIATGLTNPGAPSCTPASQPYHWTCEWTDVAVTGSDGDVTFSVSGKDDAGNDIDTTSVSACVSECNILLDTSPPYVGFDLVNDDNLDIGDQLQIRAYVSDSGSGIVGILPTDYKVFIEKNTDCDIPARTKATSCSDDPVSTDNPYICEWTIGHARQACFGKKIIVNASDLAGNYDTADLEITTQRDPGIDEFTISKGWVKLENNSFRARISTPTLQRNQVWIESNSQKIEPSSNPVYISSINKWEVQWYGNDKNEGLKYEDIHVGQSETTHTFTLKVQPDSGQEQVYELNNMPVDLEKPVFKELKVESLDESIPQPVSGKKVKVTATIEEAGSGIDPSETYIHTKNLNHRIQDSSAKLVAANVPSCSRCGCTKGSGSEEKIWTCVWEYEPFYPVSGSKLKVYTRDVAGNSKNSDDDSKSIQLSALGSSQEARDNFWTIGRVDTTPKTININMLKDQINPTGGYKTRIGVKLVDNSATTEPPDLKVYSFNLESCSSPQYSASLNPRDFNQNYLSDDRTEKYFILPLPNIRDEKLRQLEGKEIKVVCKFEIVNGDDNNIFADKEYVNATIIFDLTSKLGKNPGLRNIGKVSDTQDELDRASRWADNAKKVIDLLLPICEIGAWLTFSSAGAALALGWIPGIGQTINNWFYKVWAIWSPGSPWDIISVKFWCEMVTCGAGLNVVSGISTLATGQNSFLTSLASYSPDPRENIWISVIQIPTCITGIYTYHQAKKAMLKAESYCQKQQALLGKGVGCEKIRNEFECIHGYSSRLILSYLGSAVMSWLVNKAIEWIIDDLIKMKIICWAGVSTSTHSVYSPECFAYAGLETYYYLEKISSTKEIIQRYENMDGQTAAVPSYDSFGDPEDACGYEC